MNLFTHVHCIEKWSIHYSLPLDVYENFEWEGGGWWPVGVGVAHLGHLGSRARASPGRVNRRRRRRQHGRPDGRRTGVNVRFFRVCCPPVAYRPATSLRC